MKNIFYPLLFFTCYYLSALFLPAMAQVSVVWDETFSGDESEVASIVSSADGGYLVAGTLFYKEDNEYSVLKTDANGNRQWAKAFGGGGSGNVGFELLAKAIATADGGYLLAGSSDAFAARDKSENSKGGRDYWIVKIDAQGNKQWDKTFGGKGSEFLNDAIPTADGGYLLAGNSYSDASGDKSENSKGGRDYWIVKIDANGNKQWDKTLGGNDDDYSPHAIQTSNKGYLLAGTSESDVSGDKSENTTDRSDYWVISIDNNGNKLWDKTYGMHYSDFLTAIVATADGGYLLGGEPEYTIIKIDKNGNKQWDKTFKGNSFDQLSTIISTPDGAYLLAGTSGSNASGDKSEDSKGDSDYWIIKMDQNGNKLWDKTIGGNKEDKLVDAINANDRGYILAGHSNSDASGDKSDDNIDYGLETRSYWIVKVVETEEEDFSVRSLSLVNADTDKVLFSLQDGAVINLSDLGNPHLTVRANTTPINVGSVKLELSGPISHTQTENYWPYALFGDDPDGPRDYIGRQWKPGEYNLTVTPYLNDQKGSTVSISFQVVDDVSASVSFFVLINADTDEDIRILRDGGVIDLEALGNPQLSIRANTKPFDVDRVELALSGPFSHTKTENFWPYALFGDNPDSPRDYKGKQWQAGNYTLTATPYRNGQKGNALAISFTVTGSNSNARLAVEVYPVPTKGEITISHEGTAEEANLMLLDFAGNVLLERPLSRHAVEQLDMSYLKKGLYYLKVIQQDEVQVKRIVLE